MCLGTDPPAKSHVCLGTHAGSAAPIHCSHRCSPDPTCPATSAISLRYGQSVGGGGWLGRSVVGWVGVMGWGVRLWVGLGRWVGGVRSWPIMGVDEDPLVTRIQWVRAAWDPAAWDPSLIAVDRVWQIICFMHPTLRSHSCIHSCIPLLYPNPRSHSSIPLLDPTGAKPDCSSGREWADLHSRSLCSAREGAG